MTNSDIVTINKFPRSLIATITVKTTKQFKIRLLLGKFLIKCGLRLTGMGVEFKGE